MSRAELEAVGPNILILDDEPMVAEYLALLLQDAGVANVRCVYDLETAAEALAEARPSLAILDVNIGRHLVFPLAHMMREAGVPILFCTGMNLADLPQEWADAPVLAKPADPSLLLARLAQFGVLTAPPAEMIV